MREYKPKPRVIKDFAGLQSLLEAETPVAESQPKNNTESKKRPHLLETIFDSLSEESRRFLSEQIAKLESEDKKGLLVLQQDPSRYIRLALEKSRSPLEKVLLEKITRDLRKSISKNSRKTATPTPEAEKLAKKTPEVKTEEVTPNNSGAGKASTIQEPGGEKTTEENPLLPVNEKNPTTKTGEGEVGTINTESNEQKEIDFNAKLNRIRATRTKKGLEAIQPVIETTGSEKEISKELKDLQPEERKMLGLGIHNIGFQIERWKNNTFAWAFDKLSQTKVKKEDGTERKVQKKGFVADLTRAARNSFKADAEMAEKKILVGKNPPGLTKLSNVAYLAKNFLRPYGIFMMTSTGLTPANVRKAIMLGGMAAGRMAGITKEAILSSDKVLDQTQFSSSVEDIDAAQDEANKIYELALAKAGQGGTKENVSTEDLKKAYLSLIPKDLEERLKNKPETASIFKKDIFRMHLEFDINRLNKSIENIEQDSKYRQEKKEELKEQLLRRWEKRLTDYDRVLTRIGTIEQYSMWASYAEAGAKNVVRGMTVLAATNLAEHAYINLGKVWDSFSHGLNGQMPDQAEEIQSAGKTLKRGAKALAGKDSSPATTPTPAGVAGHPEAAATQTPAGTTNGVANEAVASVTSTPAEQVQGAAKQAAEKIAGTPVTPQAIEISHKVNLDQDVVKQGEGIEHVFIKQIEGNPKIAEALGIKDGEDIRKFAGRMAHRIALENGYVNGTTGEEIYVRKAGEAAYKLIPTGEMGHASVQEFHKEGTEFVAQKLHNPGESFEEKPDAYEMRHDRTVLHTDKMADAKIDPTEPAVASSVSKDLTKEAAIRQTIENSYRPAVANDEYDHSTIEAAEARIEEHNAARQQIEQATQDIINTVTAPNVYRLNMDNLNSLFKGLPQGIAEYANVKNQNAIDILDRTLNGKPDSGIRAIRPYLERLVTTTGLRPKESWFWGKESVQDFISRAIQKAEKMGRWKELNMTKLDK